MYTRGAYNGEGMIFFTLYPTRLSVRGVGAAAAFTHKIQKAKQYGTLFDTCILLCTHELCVRAYGRSDLTTSNTLPRKPLARTVCHNTYRRINTTYTSDNIVIVVRKRTRCTHSRPSKYYARPCFFAIEILLHADRKDRI